MPCRSSSLARGRRPVAYAISMRERGPHLHRRVLIARRLEPRVLLNGVEALIRGLWPRVMRLRLALVGIEAFVIADGIVVPGMSDVLVDLRLVHGLDMREIRAVDDARGDVSFRTQLGAR